MSISAVVITKNEEKNIERCLKSILWCDEIVIIDDYSEDSTIRLIGQISKEAKVYQRHLNKDFGTQRNFGLEKATGEWVIFIDADEVISDKLKKEIVTVIHSVSKSKTNKGYRIKRADYFGGKWLKYGETAKVKLVRLAQKGTGRWVGRVHEVWQVDGQIETLQNALLHYPHQTISEFVVAINQYTDIVAQYWKEKGRRIRIWELVIYPLGKFLQNYFLRLGILDGTAGLLMAIFMSFHSFLARGKYWMTLRYE